MSAVAITKFQEEVWAYYAQHARHDLPWRQPEADGHFDPYKILVSELMLQQTQVVRVIPKYYAFLEQFPDVKTLAAAPLSEVLKLWSGLGYNRRAKFLWQAAVMLQAAYAGEFPADQTELTKLPGVGKNTAGAIMAYAFNAPVVYMETNITTVIVHHFYDDKTDISNLDILKKVAETLPREEGKEQERSGSPDAGSPQAPMRKTVGLSHYREWYWALMDYGSYLKQTVGNKTRASKSYTKQSPFEGSKRQVRGKVLRLLGEADKSEETLLEILHDPRAEAVLADLKAEGMIELQDGVYSLS